MSRTDTSQIQRSYILLISAFVPMLYSATCDFGGVQRGASDPSPQDAVALSSGERFSRHAQESP